MRSQVWIGFVCKAVAVVVFAIAKFGVGINSVKTLDHASDTKQCSGLTFTNAKTAGLSRSRNRAGFVQICQTRHVTVNATVAVVVYVVANFDAGENSTLAKGFATNAFPNARLALTCGRAASGRCLVLGFGKVVVYQPVAIIVFVVAGFCLWTFSLHANFVCSLALVLASFTLTKGAATRTKWSVLFAIAVIVEIVATFFGGAFATGTDHATVLACVRSWAAFSNS